MAMFPIITLAAPVYGRQAVGSTTGFSRGGRLRRAGTVYHVTTLADSGLGLLRDAVPPRNRTVVVAAATPVSTSLIFRVIFGQPIPSQKTW